MTWWLAKEAVPTTDGPRGPIYVHVPGAVDALMRHKKMGGWEKKRAQSRHE